MESLSLLGLKELRFNIAATGYDNPDVRRHIEEAVNIFESVAIEIPSIPGHFSQLTKTCRIFAGIGVKYLNLHELILPKAEPPNENANRKNAVLILSESWHMRKCRQWNKFKKYN
ncbi:MAG: hypothetical protein R2861_03645 [Desulfobacterales bacterium]